jgi:putative DNA methylase
LGAGRRTPEQPAKLQHAKLRDADVRLPVHAAPARGVDNLLPTAKNISDRALFHSGVFENRKGKVALTPRDSLPVDWTPARDTHLTWECAQHVARTLNADHGGTQAAARLVAQMGPKSAEARKLAYRLFEIATQKGWSAEALVYNELAEAWPELEERASDIEPRAAAALTQQPRFFEMGA